MERSHDDRDRTMTTSIEHDTNVRKSGLIATWNKPPTSDTTAETLLNEYLEIMSILDDSGAYGVPRSSAHIELGDFVLCDYGGTKFGVVVNIPDPAKKHPYSIMNSSATNDLFETDIFTVIQIYDLKTAWNGIPCFSFSTHGSIPVSRNRIHSVGNNALFMYFSELHRKQFDASWETVDFLNKCLEARTQIMNWRMMELQSGPDATSIANPTKRKVISKMTYELRFIDTNGMYDIDTGYGSTSSDITYGIGLGEGYIATIKHYADSPYSIESLHICKISTLYNIEDELLPMMKIKDISVPNAIQFLMKFQKMLKEHQETMFSL